MQRHYPLDPATGVENTTLAWTDGIPSTGTEGSYPPHLLCTNPQDELINLITAAGITPADGDLTQILQAASIGLDIGTFGGTADALTATLPGGITIPQLVKGMTIRGIVAAANASTAPTLAVAGFTIGAAAEPIKRSDASAPAAGDLRASAQMTFRFDGTNWRIVGLALSDVVAPAPLDSEVWHTGSAGGVAAAITTTLSPAPAHGATNYFIALSIPAGFTNASAATLSWTDASGTTVSAPLSLNAGGSAVSGGELIASSEATIFYDGSKARLIGGATPSIPVATLPTFLAYRFWSTPGTYTFMPGAGCYAIEVEECIGGGGGGSYSTSGSGTSTSPSAGGAGGNCVSGCYAVTPGRSYTVIVGSAGAGGTSGSPVGGTGGSSSVGTLCTATGGAGANGNTPGAAGSGSVGQDIYPGNHGQIATGNGTGLYFPGPGGGAFGSGNLGSSGPVYSGASPGQGGTGGNGTGVAGSVGPTGGNGAAGRVKIKQLIA